MKKLLTLIFSFLIAHSALLVAQTCDFTYYQEPTTGDYHFIAPVGLDSQNTYYWLFLQDSSDFWNGNLIDSSEAGIGLHVIRSYNQPITNFVSVTVYNQNGISVCGSVQKIQIAGDTTLQTFCPIFYSMSPSSAYSFTFSSPGAISLSNWHLGNDSIISSGFEFTYTFPCSGVYNICMETASEGLLCSNCAFVTVWGDSVVNPLTCEANFYTYANGNVVYFIPTGNINTSNTSFFWDFGDGVTSTEVFPFHEYDFTSWDPWSDSEEVTLLTYSNDGCVDTCWNYAFSNYYPVYLWDSCFTYFVFTQQNPFEVNIVNLSIANDVTYSWTLNTPAGNSTTQTGPYPSFYADSIGSYGLCLTISNGTDCISTFCDTILVEPNGFSDGKISADGVTFNVVSPQEVTGYEVNGISNSNTTKVDIFPNPFNDVLNISDEGTIIKSYEIYSIDGKRVMKGAINGNGHTIITPSLNSGMYFINLIDINGTRLIRRVVKS